MGIGEGLSMKKGMTRQILVIVATLATIAMNALASTLPLNGLTTGEISDRFQVYFVPAGYVFSIWGVIYLWLIAYSVYQALPAQRENPRLRSMGYLYVWSAVANVVWLVFWHYELFPLTLLVMLVLLGLLIAIYLRLETGRTAASAGETWAVRVAFSIYLGWITVATVANATSLLDYLGWGGWGIAPQVWAVIMLVVATAIAAGMSLNHGDVAYIAVIVWAFAGIALKHAGVPLVSITAWAMAAIAALSLVMGVPRVKRGLGK
jgi:hypothetical protein